MGNNKEIVRTCFSKLWVGVRRALDILQDSNCSGTMVNGACRFLTQAGRGFMGEVIDQYLSSPKLWYARIIYIGLNPLSDSELPGASDKLDFAIQLANVLYERAGQRYGMFIAAFNLVCPDIEDSEQKMADVNSQVEALRRKFEESDGKRPTMESCIKALREFLNTFVGDFFGGHVPKPGCWKTLSLYSLHCMRTFLEISTSDFAEHPQKLNPAFRVGKKWLANDPEMLRNFMNVVFNNDIPALQTVVNDGDNDLESAEGEFRDRQGGYMTIVMQAYLASISAAAEETSA